jgi:hypothetical protein
MRDGPRISEVPGIHLLAKNQGIHTQVVTQRVHIVGFHIFQYEQASVLSLAALRGRFVNKICSQRRCALEDAFVYHRVTFIIELQAIASSRCSSMFRKVMLVDHLAAWLFLIGKLFQE